MRGAWRNDRFFARLAAHQRRAYGSGGGGTKDIVNTDSHDQVMPDDPVDSGRMPVSQPVLFPSNADYDTPDNLEFDLNQKMPYHEGGVDEHVEGEKGRDLKDLTESQNRQHVPYGQATLWDQSYSSQNQFDDGGGTELHMGAVNEPTGGRDIVVTIPKLRLREVEAEEQANKQGLGYYWEMGRLPREQPRRIYFVWDDAVRAYHDVTGMDHSSGRILMRPEIHHVTPIPMSGFRGFRYYAARSMELQRSEVSAQRKPWVAVDLDGTILADVPKPYPPTGPSGQLPLGPPLPGARDALSELARLGWRISVFSARFGDDKLNDATVAQWANEIAQHLTSQQIPFSDIWVGRKPRADYFVDNKAIRFDGDWPSVLEQLTLVDAPPRGPSTEEASLGAQGAGTGDGGPLDFQESDNDFDDPMGDRGSRGIPRPPELEEALYG